MNYCDKIEKNYKAQMLLFPSRTKEHNLLIALSRIMSQVLPKLKKDIEPINEIDTINKLIGTTFDRVGESLEKVAKEIGADLGIESFYAFMLKYHPTLVMLGSAHSKYKEIFEDLISYLESLETSD